jgi:aminodeoxychorismate synthase component I
LIGGGLAAYRLKNAAGAKASVAKLRHDGTSYLGMIQKAQEHIAAGDVYQICLTNQIEIEHNLDPLSVFLNLREANPAPYAAYLKMGNRTVVSSSPEQFIQVSPQGQISTKPIKGTRRRDANPELDLANARELRENEKERAENLMIVDLMRNDIGKVALADSVKVPKLFEVESYATVHQLVSTVEAQLAQGQNAFTALDAAFPGGSMTGAPKVRAMEIIAQLEKGARGVYSGAIGYFGFNGAAEFGMTIRTVVFEGGHASIGVGGGITIDSDPIAELEETKLKAQALLRVLNAPDPWA